MYYGMFSSQKRWFLRTRGRVEAFFLQGMIAEMAKVQLSHDARASK